MLKYRAISFPSLLALLALIIFWPKGGPWLFAAVASIAAALMVYETGAMLKKIAIDSFVRSSAVWTGMWFAALLFSGVLRYSGFRYSNLFLGILMFALLVGVIYLAWFLLLFRPNKRENLDRMLCSLGILVITVIPLLMLTEIYNFGAGAYKLLFVILVTKAMDTGGYIFGMLSGKYLPGGNHKIVPSISPKKSWEGTFGGIVLSVAVSCCFLIWLPVFRTGVWWYLVAGVVLAIGSFAGDLTESALKRTCGVKDSANWIPGMGGVFDVLDSFIYNGVLFWFLAMFL